MTTKIALVLDIKEDNTQTLVQSIIVFLNMEME